MDGRGEGEKWRIKERRRYGPERGKIRGTGRKRQKKERVWRDVGEVVGGRERKRESISGRTDGTDLSWRDIRRTSRP